MSDALPPPMPSAEGISALTETFRLLGDTSRLRILLLCMSRPRPVGEIADTLGLSQSLVSHHLRLLRTARLVRARRQSRQMIYALTDRHVSDMLRDMVQHIAEKPDLRETSKTAP